MNNDNFAVQFFISIKVPYFFICLFIKQAYLFISNMYEQARFLDKTFIIFSFYLAKLYKQVCLCTKPKTQLK